MHVPQSVEAATELREIAAVSKQLISPRLSKPLVSVVQDTLVGVNRLTRPTEFFTRREMMNLLVHSKRWDGRIPAPAKTDPVPMWSGQQIVSALLPAIHIAMGNKMWDEEKGKGDPNYVIINNGTIMQGILDGDIFDKALIHMLYNDFSPEMTVDFLDGLQQVVATYLQNAGFSVGMSDLIADAKTLSDIQEESETLKRRLESIQQQVHMGLFDNTSGRTNQEEFEIKVFQNLDKITGGAGKMGLRSLAANNRMVNMVKCGSKGSDVNIAQMIALLGQQAIDGKRIPYGFQDRTLPHFKRYDDGAEARGFIESSFVKGLKPHEFYFHAMTGREGLIDTAVKSVTGDTPIVILENGMARKVPIGPWIDAQLSAGAAKVEKFAEKNMEMLHLEHPVFIPTADGPGNVSWGAVSAITRHDPGTKLYKVATAGGKTATVSESQSLLIYDETTKEFIRALAPLVRAGQYVPSTAYLPAPPTQVDAIPLSAYLPKTAFLYGTEFHAAKAAMETAMEGRQRIPAAWWATANGSAFTLPYSSKARFQRALIRANTANIHPGYVYPFTSNREHSRIPDQFALTEENGLFLGLFLAEGNVDITSGYVQITNNNADIRAAVASWFDAHGICHNESTKTNAIGGTSSDIRGYSTVLAQFLTAFVGHGAAHKRIPAELFAAPEPFIRGLLNGYFSGDGTVSATSVEVGSASSELIEGISMLCTRMGIFGKVSMSQLASNNVGTVDIAPTHRLAIRAQWASRFAKLIPLIDDAKQQRLQVLRASEEHRNFRAQNDVVLDQITEITELDASAHPKLYDLTVPSTLNFGLANGMHVVDTADSGYMQRQLVKTMEDLMTYHDGTVRDAGGLVVQFAYGDDGTSATKIENQPIDLAKLSDSDIRTRFSVDDVAAERSQRYIAQIMEDRDILVRNVWGGRVDKSVQCAVHLPRLIANAIQQLGLEGGKGTPVPSGHVLDTIDRILQRTRPDNRLWGALLRFHLNPKTLIGRGFTRAAFDWLAEQIVVKHMKSWVVPGEMTGILAAQSLGEPTTQMSTVGSALISVMNLKNPEKYYSGPVGPFIDALMAENADSVIDIGHGSSILDLPPEWQIMGVSNAEKASWKPISQLSRHPANGGLVKVHTKSGRSTTATLSHSFLRRTTNGIAEIKGADLRTGMRIPVGFRLPESPIALTSYNGYALTKEFGWLVGIYLADGSFNGRAVRITKLHPVVEHRIRALAAAYPAWVVSIKEYQGGFGPGKDTLIHDAHLKNTIMELCNTGSYDKRVNVPIFHANRDFIAGVLSGYFDGDGNINASRQQIRVGSRSEPLIRDIARLLAYQGIFATICEERSARQPGQVMYTCNVIRKHAARFQENIGLSLPEKAAALAEIVAYNARDAHSQREDVDMIPELGDVIAETGRLLRMPGQSRTYGRFASDRPNPKMAIGRRTLENYISEFREMMAIHVDADAADQVATNMAILESAATSDLIWDEIVSLEIMPDPEELVYDFTVPGNDSFMVDDNIFVHNTLNTFHLSGVAAKSGMTRGVPRLKELLKATQNPKATSLTIFLREDIRGVKEEARRLAQELEFTMLRDLVKASRIYYDPRDSASLIAEDNDWLPFFASFEAETEEEPSNPWIIRLELDREKMFNKNITMDDIYYVIRNTNRDANVTYTDHNASRMVCRIRIGVVDQSLNDLSQVKAAQNKLLTQTLVRGLPGLRAVSYRKLDMSEQTYERNPAADGKYEPVEQFVLDTFGTNFLDVMVHPDVDGLRLISNHVHDINEILGIEAARNLLFKEIFGLFESAAPVNSRHVSMLCDAMCNRGRMMSADRIGVNKKTKLGPLAKASFEQTGDIMLRAALFGEMDPVTGVSANIMTGQPIRGGTSMTQILLDEGAFLQFMKDGVGKRKVLERAPTLVQEEVERLLEKRDAPGCRPVDLRIPTALPPVDPQAQVPDTLPDLEVVLVDE